MFARTSVRVLVIACVLSACGTPKDDHDAPTEGQPEALTVSKDVTSVAIRDERSLVVTHPRGLSDVEDRFSLGRLLEQQAIAAANAGGMGKDEGGNPVPDPNDITHATAPQWVDSVFQRAEKNIDEHSDAPARARLGIVPVENPMARLRALWSGKNGNLDSKARPAPRLTDGPFRLLAVVNRLDIAGDVDSRDCCTGAARLPRPFGEGRLVFGLVDPAMEGRANPKPYPFTIIVEFRLPALGPNLNPLDDFSYRGAMTNDAVWRTQMERWGTVWQEQSRYAPNDPAFQSRLAEIVARFARPENFLSIRTGFDLENANGKHEFEYREWYILRPGTQLIPRKPRREPYRCGAGGTSLTKVVEAQWNDAKDDLQMIGLGTNGKSTSYDFPRDDGGNPFGLDGPMAGCPTDNGVGIPFEMDGQARDDGAPESVATAPFSRFGKDDVWTLKGVAGNAEKREDVRHAFAIRTCSGCHGKEAGLFGFQINPRLKGEESVLSDFMTGKGGTQFSHDGASYHYDDLRTRHDFLASAAKRDANLQIYAGLWRHDRK